MPPQLVQAFSINVPYPLFCRPPYEGNCNSCRCQILWQQKKQKMVIFGSWAFVVSSQRGLITPNSAADFANCPIAMHPAYNVAWGDALC